MATWVVRHIYRCYLRNIQDRERNMLHAQVPTATYYNLYLTGTQSANLHICFGEIILCTNSRSALHDYFVPLYLPETRIRDTHRTIPS